MRVLGDLGLAKQDIIEEIAKGGGVDSIKPVKEFLLCVKQLETPGEGVIPKTSTELQESANEFATMYRTFLDRMYECVGDYHPKGGQVLT